MNSLAPLNNLRPVLRALDGPSAASIWLVGGAIRDAWLGRPIKDVDFAVKGDPLAAAKKLGDSLSCRPFALDEERGVYRIVWKGTGDGEELQFDFSKVQGGGITQDLARRDFSINALAIPIKSLLSSNSFESDLIDNFKSIADLKNKKVSPLSEKNLKDDPLRLLRAFRFAAQLDFALTPAALRLIRRHAKLLKKPAPERIQDELFKILETSRGAAAFREIDKAGILTVIFPEGEDMRRTARAYYGKGGVLDHSIRAMQAFEWLMPRLKEFFPKFHARLDAHIRERMGNYPRFVFLKLAEWLHDVGKPATAKMEKGKMHFHGHDYVGMKISRTISQRLRFSHEQARSLARLVQGHMRPGNLGHQPVLTDRAIYRFYRDLEEDAVAMLLVSLADHFTYLSDAQRRSRKDPVINTIKTMLAKHFLTPETVTPPKIIDGNDLMKKLKLRPGPEIGRLLDAVREAQASGKVKTKDHALALAARLAKANSPVKGRSH